MQNPFRSIPKFTVAEKAMLALSVFGAGSMLYLLKVHYAGGSGVCDFGAGFNCQIVNQSMYADVLGVPVSALGLMFFVTVATVAWTRSRWAMPWVQLFTVGSLVFSLYLSFIEYRVLYSICVFCEASKLAMVGILALAYRDTREGESVVSPHAYAAAVACGAAFTWAVTRLQW